MCHNLFINLYYQSGDSDTAALIYSKYDNNIRNVYYFSFKKNKLKNNNNEMTG